MYMDYITTEGWEVTIHNHLDAMSSSPLIVTISNYIEGKGGRGLCYGKVILFLNWMPPQAPNDYGLLMMDLPWFGR